MPWTPLIFATTVVGVICGNRFLDNRLRQLSAPYAAAVKNSDAQRVAIIEGIENMAYDTSKNDEKNSYPCRTTDDLTFFNLADCFLNLDLTDNKKNANEEFDFESKGKDLSEESILPLDTKMLYKFNNFKDKHKHQEIHRNPDSRLISNDDFYDVEMVHTSLPKFSTYNVPDFYKDLLAEVDTKEMDLKRGTGLSTIGCDCKIKNDLLDLGQRHFPRYLLNAVCQPEENASDIQAPRCWRGICKPLEYKVKVLTFRTIKDHPQKDPALAWLPDDLRQLWKFKTVTVAAGCFCAVA